MRIYKIDVKTLIQALDVEKLTDVSKVYRDVHFQRGTKSRLYEWLKSAKNQKQVKEVWTHVYNLFNIQQKTYRDLINEFIGDDFELNRAISFITLLDDKQTLRFLDMYFDLLETHLISEQIRQLEQEFLLNQF